MTDSGFALCLAAAAVRIGLTEQDVAARAHRRADDWIAADDSPGNSTGAATKEGLLTRRIAAGGKQGNSGERESEGFPHETGTP